MDRCQCINQEGGRVRLSPIPEQNDSFFSSVDVNCERDVRYFPTPSNDTNNDLSAIKATAIMS